MTDTVESDSTQKKGKMAIEVGVEKRKKSEAREVGPWCS